MGVSYRGLKPVLCIQELGPFGYTTVSFLEAKLIILNKYEFLVKWWTTRPNSWIHNTGFKSLKLTLIF